MSMPLGQLLAANFSPLLVFLTIAAVASFFENRDNLNAKAQAAIASCILIPLTITALAYATGWLEVG